MKSTRWSETYGEQRTEEMVGDDLEYNQVVNYVSPPKRLWCQCIFQMKSHCSASLQNPCIPTLILPQRYLPVEKTARPSSVSCIFGPVQKQAEPPVTPLDSFQFLLAPPYTHLYMYIHPERRHRRVPAKLAHICTARSTTILSERIVLHQEEEELNQ